MSLAAFSFTNRVFPIVEIGVGDTRTPVGAATWDNAHWDDDSDAHWSGVEPTWRDITCETFSAQCQYGRDHATDRFSPGVATILIDNASGWADIASSPADPNVLSMRPGRAIRFGVFHIGYGTRWLFRGFVDAITPRYDPTLSDVVQLDCIDALGEVNRAQLVAVDEPLWPGDPTDVRIGRILDLAQWPSVKRDLQPSSTTLLADVFGGQVADLLSQAADSAGGAVFGDLDGNVVFRNRDWQMFGVTDPNDGSIGNVDPGTAGYWTDPIPPQDAYLDPMKAASGEGTEMLSDARGRVWTVNDKASIVRYVPEIPPQWVERSGDVCPVSWERPFARSDLATRVIMGNRAEPPDVVQVDDEAGQALYGIEPFEQIDLLTERADMLTTLADRILRTRSAQSAPRVRSVVLDARTADNVIDLMTTVDVYKPSRYRCRLAYPRGEVFDAEHFATGVIHELTRDEWTLSLSLDLAAPWMATGGRWDSAFWDQAAWSAGVVELQIGAPA